MSNTPIEIEGGRITKTNIKQSYLITIVDNKPAH